MRARLLVFIFTTMASLFSPAAASGKPKADANAVEFRAGKMSFSNNLVTALPAKGLIIVKKVSLAAQRLPIVH